MVFDLFNYIKFLIRNEFYIEHLRANIA